MTGLLTEPARPAVVRHSPLAPWLAVGTVCFGAFMGQLDASVVTLAFPAMQRQFDTRLVAVQWVSLAYLVTLVALLVPVGRWSDRVGRKLVYLYGFVVFTAASAACGFAATLWALVGFRVIQAVGAAMLQTNSVALVATSVPAGRRRAALGVQAAAQSLGLAVGPAVGGLLVSAVSWRWIFWINVPVGVVAVAAGALLLPRSRGRTAVGGLDLVGTVLLATASTAVLVAQSSLSGLPVAGVVVVGLAAAAMGTVGGLLWWERRSSAPLLDMRLLASRPVAAGLVGALAAYLVLFGPLVLFAQDLAGGAGAGLRGGAVLTALPAGFGLAAVAAERVLPAGWSNRCRGVAGGLLAAGAAAGLAVSAPGAVTVVLLGLLGVGLGVFVPANNATVVAAIPAGQESTAGGMLNMTRGLGTALGVAVVSLALHLSNPGALAGGVAGTMTVLAVVAGTAAVTAYLAGPGALRCRSRGRSDPAAGGAW